MSKNKDVISLFSSAGIGDLGIRESGLDLIVSNEMLEDRHDIYERNFPNVQCVTGNVWEKENEIISSYRKKHSSEPFMVFATPPCQGMSSNGAGRLKWEIEQGNRVEEDPRNRLIIPTMNITTKLKPEWLVMENVPGMKNTIIRDENNNYVNIIEYISNRLGNEYEGIAEVVACEDFKIPQMRKRLITIFTRNKNGKKFLRNKGSFLEHLKSSKKITLRDAISHLPELHAIEGKNERCDFHPLHFVSIMKPEKYWWVSHTKEGDQAYNNQCVKCNYQENQRHFDKNVNGKWVSNKSTPINCTECGELLPRPTMIDKVTGKRRLIKGFHSAYRRMHYDRPANTLTQNFVFEASDNKIHPEQNRVLSIYEALIIQTIDKYDYDFKLNGKYISKSKFAQIIGESVPPLLIENVVSGIKESMKEFVPTTLFPVS